MTGRELLVELQRHPHWLDRPVALLVPGDSSEDEPPVLLGVDEDSFTFDGPSYLILSALECDRPEQQIVETTPDE